MLEMHAMNDGAQDVQYARLAGDERQSASVHPTPQQYSLLDADQLPSEPKRYARKLSNIRHPCPTCCAVFSLSGMVFLLWVSVFLAWDSTYLILDGTDDKTKLAGSVYGAAGMYLACFLVSAEIPTCCDALNTRVFGFSSSSSSPSLSDLAAFGLSRKATIFSCFRSAA